MDLAPDQIDERRELLQKCLGMSVIQAQSYANQLSEEQFLEVINATVRDMVGMNMRRPETFPDCYFGQYYTIHNYRVSVGDTWEKLEQDILQCLVTERQAKEVIEYFLHQPDFEADFTGVKARFSRWRNTLDALLGFKLIRKLPGRGKDTTVYALHAEIAPLLRRVLASPRAQELPVINSEAAQAELAYVQQMERQFEDYLRDLLENRCDEVLEFGRDKMSLGEVARYLEDLFGPMLYFDCLLAIAHQYGMTGTEIVNPQGTRAGSTGFHLALFGAPGTGKTFAVKDLIIGDDAKNVLAHGLPGLNRYCGGMTAANFIRIGEAYQGKRFNFVVTEFNDWFRYKGMVEPLKLALEQGHIRYETKTETIGPYQFGCYFSTNYNTEVNRDAGYRVTIADPNFNAIEDRMLVRMHRMTKQRLRELSRNQRDLALGRLRMGLARDIRDHLALVYAIQIQHPLTRERFQPKQIVVRDSFFAALDRAQDSVLEQIHGPLQFSVRVRQNAMKLAGALTLFAYFAQPSERLEITGEAQNLALKFFVEEVAIRQKVGVDIESVLYRLGLSELNRVSQVAQSVRKTVSQEEDPAAALDRWRAMMSHELKLLESKYGRDAGWNKHLERIQADLGPLWEGLPEEVQQFLCTGEVLLRELDRLDDEGADYSAVIVEYSKALELALEQVCFAPFREEIRARDRARERLMFECDESAGSLSPADRKQAQQSMDLLRKYLLDDQALTLGHMWRCLIWARKQAPPGPVLAALRSHCLSHPDRRALVEAGFIAELGKYIEMFRNAAAHTKPMTRGLACQCREVLLEGPGALFTVVAACAQTSSGLARSGATAAGRGGDSMRTA